ncbi:feruloyl-CoA synthase [Pseudomonas sp. NPDC089392]|uniref:feruloyl-CoA synthase n=1 Tax=Pseudomonas sp. NPDC089392 TaxID=3364459 RepID=UPI00380492BB
MNSDFVDCDERPALVTPLRAVAIGRPGVAIEQIGNVTYLRSTEPLGPYPRRLMERLVHWAQVKPDQTFVAQRDAAGCWQHITYAQMLGRVRSIAQHLTGLGLSQQRPLVILSGNDLEHLQLSFAALYCGIPYCPVSPAYSTVSQDFEKLRHIISILEPGLVFAAKGEAYTRAIEAVVPADTPVLLTSGQLPGRRHRVFSDLLGQTPCAEADAAFEAVQPSTIAKFLFTSGSTKLPKAVITTQQMLCANQQMLLQTFPEFGVEPPVLVDWLPWNHTFGGSHNVGIVLYNGGSFYIDDGKPTPQYFAETLRNLGEISPTAYLTVPKGWEELVSALEADPELRTRFFARMKLFFFAGAGLSQAVWNRLDNVAMDHCAERIQIMASLGMTETAPSCTFTTGPLSVSGYIGLPAPGCEVKMVPADGKFEVRFRGPHVMPGYWRSPEQTAQAFDEEGFYRTGDAVRFADADCPQLGLMFDGRIAEDFKLTSGGFVSVGPLRARVIAQGTPYIHDVVVTGPDRERIGLLIFPCAADIRRLAGVEAGTPLREALNAASVKQWLLQLIDELNCMATGVATRVDWAALLDEPASLDRGELTDKGSINQRAVMTHRAEKIEALYSGRDPDRQLASVR